ncbi:MAG: putative bifunctional diguanylate cyclase/phosphodiesterase [Gammaproteobacteria bacterium]
MEQRGSRSSLRRKLPQRTEPTPVGSARIALVADESQSRGIPSRRAWDDMGDRLSDTFVNAPIGILLVDFDGSVQKANPVAEAMLGHMPGGLEGSSMEGLVSREAAITLLGDLKTVLQNGGRVSRPEWQLCSGDGREVWANVHVMVQRSAHGAPLCGIVLLTDITETKRNERAMERLAFYDTLTDLGNRRLFNERLAFAVERSRREHSRGALLYLDLDQFKRVNDTLGHDCGDQLLREVGARLLNCVRTVDTVARTGGDEFCILLEHIDGPRAASEVARRIFEVLKLPIRVAGQDIEVTTSIGITLIPEDGIEPKHLLKNADLAMYRAKEQGRNTHQYYSESLNEHVSQRLRTEQALRHALERGEFRMVYQGLREPGSRRLVGFESLLRWVHPTLGTVGPAEFISIAEESGLIIDIGRWIIGRVCADGTALMRAAGRALTIAINVSPRQFRDASFVQAVEDAIATTGIDPENLVFEITETTFMHDVETTSTMVYRLAALGVRIAIDDFGTGYSSLNYLRKFPISTVKVDRSFVRDIPSNSDDCAITAAVIAMAHRLNVTVVAEGVETEAQRAFLLEHGCDVAQGYLFSRPAPLEAALAEATDAHDPR